MTATMEISCLPASGKICHITRSPCPGECVFAEILESVSLGIVLFDVAKRELIFANHFARELFRSQGVAIDYATLASRLLPPDGEVPGEPFAPEPWRLDNRLLGFTAYGTDRFAWVFLRDITEKLRLESIAEAMETTNNIGYVFSAVRHEIGNPINAMKAALTLVASNLRTFPIEVTQDYLHRVIDEIRRVEGLLQSLKSFSMYERLELRPTASGVFLRNLLTLVRPEMARRSIDLFIEQGAEVSLVCDARALQQVLLNVLTNAADALDASEAPSIRLSLAIHANPSGHEPLATLRVIDNGPGIPLEEQLRLFKPFHTTKANGTGLGLVIARKLLARMGGTIEVESEVGRGTVVAVTLPCEETRLGVA